MTNSSGNKTWHCYVTPLFCVPIGYLKIDPNLSLVITFKISRMYFHNGRKKQNGKFSWGAYSNISGKFEYLQRYVQLIFIVFRLCKSVWGAVTVIWVSLCFGFLFPFYISVLGIPGYFPGITIVIWWSLSYLCGFTSACYLIAGITAALAPAFISSPMTESLFTAKLVIISLLVWGMVNFVVRSKSTKI